MNLNRYKSRKVRRKKEGKNEVYFVWRRAGKRKLLNCRDMVFIFAIRFENLDLI